MCSVNNFSNNKYYMNYVQCMLQILEDKASLEFKPFKCLFAFLICFFPPPGKIIDLFGTFLENDGQGQFLLIFLLIKTMFQVISDLTIQQ